MRESNRMHKQICFLSYLPMMIFVIMFMGCGGDLGDMPNENNIDRQKWDKKYNSDEFIYGKDPVIFLKKSLHLLPKGKALDIAAGEGRNAVFLAENGWDVDAVDVSKKGLEKANKLAKEKNTKIHTLFKDLRTYKLPKNTYDVIVNFYYLQRDLFPQIKEALKPGGMIVFETFTVEHLTVTGSKMKREYCLEKEELKEAFSDFEIIQYEEIKNGNKAIAHIIARKKK